MEDVSSREVIKSPIWARLHLHAIELSREKPRSCKARRVYMRLGYARLDTIRRGEAS